MKCLRTLHLLIIAIWIFQNDVKALGLTPPTNSTSYCSTTPDRIAPIITGGILFGIMLIVLAVTFGVSYFFVNEQDIIYDGCSRSEAKVSYRVKIRIGDIPDEFYDENRERFMREQKLHKFYQPSLTMDIHDSNKHYQTRWVVPISRHVAHRPLLDLYSSSCILKFTVKRISPLHEIGGLRLEHDSFKHTMCVYGVEILEEGEPPRVWKCKVNQTLKFIGPLISDTPNYLLQSQYYQVTRRGLLSTADSLLTANDTNKSKLSGNDPVKDVSISIISAYEQEMLVFLFTCLILILVYIIPDGFCDEVNDFAKRGAIAAALAIVGHASIYGMYYAITSNSIENIPSQRIFKMIRWLVFGLIVIGTIALIGIASVYGIYNTGNGWAKTAESAAVGFSIYMTSYLLFMIYSYYRTLRAFNFKEANEETRLNDETRSQAELSMALRMPTIISLESTSTTKSPKSVITNSPDVSNINPIIAKEKTSKTTISKLPTSHTSLESNQQTITNLTPLIEREEHKTNGSKEIQ